MKIKGENFWCIILQKNFKLYFGAPTYMTNFVLKIKYIYILFQEKYFLL